MKKGKRAVPTAKSKAPDPRNTIDSFQNFAAKLGVSAPGFRGRMPNLGGAEGIEGDNLVSRGHYEFNLLTRNRIQLEAAYRGSWAVGKVIDCKAEDMTRAGVQITSNKDAETVPKIQREISRLQIWQSMCKNKKWADLYGGCIAVMQIEGQDLATPLDIDTVGKGQFKGLTTYDRWQLAPSLLELINSGPELGLPQYYDIVNGNNVNDPGQAPLQGQQTQSTGRVRVHHTRCIRMIGHELPFFQAQTEMLWGESVLERLWDRLIAFDDATMNVVGLIHRAQLRTVGVDGLRQILAMGGEAQEALVAQFEMMRQLQSNEGITLLDKEDMFASTAYSFAGIPDVMIQVGQQLSGACDIPLVRFFGQSPAGMNATGEADIRLYYDGINARQEASFRNPVEMILKVLWRSVTGKAAPKDLEFTFTPLWQVSATEKATVAKTNTDTITEAHTDGLIDTATAMKELKQQSRESGIFTHITDESIAEAENDEPPLPETTAEPGTELEEKEEDETKPKPKATGDSITQKIKRLLGLEKKLLTKDSKRLVAKRVQISDDRKRIADWMAKRK